MSRNAFMVAAQASLQAMHPHRLVKRGLQDPAQLGDAALLQGVFALIADGTKGWPAITGREGEWGTLTFSVVGYLRVPEGPADDPAYNVALAVEEAEAVMEAELLAWCQAIKPDPLDAVYPQDSQYSRGLDAPVGWVAMTLEALYV